MYYIFMAFGLLPAYIVGLVGVLHTSECGGKGAGLGYGIPVMLLSLYVLVPSIEMDAPWLWLLFAGAPLVLCWLTFWNGFRKAHPRRSWFIGIVTAGLMLGVGLALYFWPAPLQWLALLIGHYLPLPGYPMA